MRQPSKYHRQPCPSNRKPLVNHTPLWLSTVQLHRREVSVLTYAVDRIKSCRGLAPIQLGKSLPSLTAPDRSPVLAGFGMMVLSVVATFAGKSPRVPRPWFCLTT